MYAHEYLAKIKIEHKENIMEKKLLNVDELCTYLAIPKGTVYSWVSLNRIPSECIRKIGRSLKFEKTEIDAWINTGASEPTQVKKESDDSATAAL